MLSATSGILKRAAFQDLKCSNSAFSLEFVRWRRKPRWLPVGKSKLYRIPEHKPQTPEEKAELQRLHNDYRTQMRSLRQFFRVEMIRMQQTTTADHIVLTPEQEQAEFERCVAVNEAWNEEIAMERDARLQQERTERAKYIRERLDLAKIREEEQRERYEEVVRKQKELSKTFIPRENIDAAIEYALANPVDYNFSIDLQGNMYHGRQAVPGGTAPPSTSANDEEVQQLTASN